MKQTRMHLLTTHVSSTESYQKPMTGGFARRSSRSLHKKTKASVLRQTEPLLRTTNPWFALFALGFGAFMALLDTSIVNITLPTLQTAFHTDFVTVSWVLHIYNLVFAAFLITAGRLGDLFGRKRFTLIGLLLFTGGSVLCGVSPSIVLLLGARGVQAAGAAVLSAVSLAQVHVLFPKEKRGLAVSVFGTLNALGFAVGPIVGGVLLPLFGWRSIFLVNIPFCLVGFVLVSLVVPETRDGAGKKRIDVVGMVTISLTLLSLVLAVVKGSDWGWSSPPILSLFGWALVGFVLFVFVELRHPAPLLDLMLFSSPHFTLANVSTFLYCLAMQGGSLFLSLYFLNARGETQFATALAVLPVSLAAFVIPNVISRMGHLAPPWLRCLLGMCCLALGLLLLCTLTMHSTFLTILWREILFGAGIGLCLGNFPVLALADVPAEKLGAASGTLNTFRQVGLVLGVALLIGMFSGQLYAHMQTARTDTMTMVQADTHLSVEVRKAMLSQLFPSDMQAPPSRTALVQLTDEHPSWQLSRGELVVLSQQIEQVFDGQTIAAYTAIWALAALFPTLGIGFVLALLIVSRRQLPHANVQMAVWNSFYFFSLSGGITAQTIQSYLAAHHPSFAVSSAGPPKQKRVYVHLSRKAHMVFPYTAQKGERE